MPMRYVSYTGSDVVHQVPVDGRGRLRLDSDVYETRCGRSTGTADRERTAADWQARPCGSCLRQNRGGA